MINGFVLHNGFYSKDVELNIQPFIHIIFEDFGLKLGSNELKSCILELTKESISLKENQYYDESDIVIINSLSQILNEPINSIIDYLIYKKENITYERFFNLLTEESKTFSFLEKSIPQLKLIGLDFKLSEKEIETDIAINCQKYIKFIRKESYNLELQIQEHIDKLTSELNNIATRNWINGIYKRHLLKGNAIQNNEIHHIIDWFNSLSEFSILEKNLSFEKAVAKSIEWTLTENLKLGITNEKDELGKDLELIIENGGYHFFKLISTNAKKREGQKMKNCIGRLHVNADNIFSIRYNDKRIASIKIDLYKANKTIIECKGPCNKAVNEAHHKKIQEILTQFSVDLLNSYDILNIGLKKLIVKKDTSYHSNILYSELIDSNSPHYSNPTIIIDNLWEDLFTTPRSFHNFQEKANQILLNCKNKLIQEITKKEINKFIENSFECPLSGLFITKNNDYEFKITQLNSNDINILKKEFNIKDNKKLSFSNIRNEVKEFLLQILQEDKLRMKYPDVCDQIYHNIAKTNLSPELKECSILYTKIFNIKKTNNLYQMFLENLNIAVNANQLLDHTKWNLDSLNFSNFELIKYKDSHHSCPSCDAERMINDQIIAIDNFNSNVDNLNDEKLTELINDLLSEFKDHSTELISFIKKLRHLDCFDYIQGKTSPIDIQTLKEIISETNELINVLCNINYEDIYLKIRELDNEISNYYEEINALDDILKEIDRNSSPDKCNGCDYCSKGEIENNEGEQETCSYCNGDYSACDIGLKISYNRDSAPSWISYERSDIIQKESQTLWDFYKSLESISHDAKGFKQTVVDLINFAIDPHFRNKLF